MKLLLLQTDTRWLAPDLNRRRAEEMIEGAVGAYEGGVAGSEGGEGGVDLIVLPEMFTTGFAVDPTEAAEPDGTETLAWMRSTAARYDAAVAGSVAVSSGNAHGELSGADFHTRTSGSDRTGKRYFNRLFFVKPDGSVTRYDKRHLFSFAGEHLRYTAGDERVVVEWRGWRILLQVCYDLRFPVFARNLGDYDMALYVASWPTVRIHPWNTLLRARAIENVSYAVGVNRTGSDPFATYSGGTALIDFRGETLAAAAPDTEQAVTCELSMEALRAFRTKFPALSDADDFSLTIKQINER